MEAPPPYIPTRPKANKTLIIILVVFGLLVCCGLPLALLGGGWYIFNKGKPLVPCVMGLSAASRALVAYADKNGKYPPAEKWQEAVKEHFQFPAEMRSQMDRLGIKTPSIDEPLVCWNEEPKTGIAYNSDFAGKTKEEMAKNLEAVILFEAPEVKFNLAQKYVERPTNTAPKLMGQPRAWMVYTLKNATTKEDDFNLQVSARAGEGKSGTVVEMNSKESEGGGGF